LLDGIHIDSIKKQDNKEFWQKKTPGILEDCVEVNHRD
jgi:hypothetical protein